MSGLLPSESDSAAEQADAAEQPEAEADAGEDMRVLWLEDDDAESLIASLSSDTARSILSALHEQPHTASELAETVDTSLQNARHHLSNLREADVVEVTDTRYSVKGREMNVYAPADDSLVVCVGGSEDRSSLLDSLRSTLGSLAVLLAGTALVQWLFGVGVVDLGGPGTAPRVGDSVGDATGALLGTLPPGAAFLLGGLVALTTVLALRRLD